MAALAVHPTETKEACHAIQSPGSPDYGHGAGPGARSDRCRLQQQLKHVRGQLECSGLRIVRFVARGHRSPPGSSGTGNSAAVAEITANWEKFFSSSTPVSQKVTLLQNGSTFEGAIKAFASFPLASSLGAKVTNVTVNSATSATVTYNITTSSGSSLLPNQKGTAVYQDGVWKVGDASLCGLLKLVPGSSAPAACSSVS